MFYIKYRQRSLHPVILSFFQLRSKTEKHWNKLKNKEYPKALALQHFDDFYKKYLEKKWPSVRIALLSPSKYCAFINNFAINDEVQQQLEELGAFNIGKYYNEIITKHNSVERKSSNKNRNKKSDERENQSEILENDTIDDQWESFEDSRVIKSIKGPGGTGQRAVKSLYEFIPATKLKGLEDFKYDSDYYAHYDISSDVGVDKFYDEPVQFPEKWKIFSFPRGNISRFPSPRRDLSNLFTYYLLDTASILPVLALNITKDDKVLDMCAAPGGKSLAMLQTLNPFTITVNDSSKSRLARVNEVFKTYIPKMQDSTKKFTLTRQDGTNICNDNVKYTKILVDAPCTNDRHSLFEDDNNIFSKHRIREKVQLPELQMSLLSSALKSLEVGGSAVYSTCTISPIQNDGVVHMALSEMKKTTHYKFQVHNLLKWIQPLKFLFNFQVNMKYGQLALPHLPLNCGPIYFCKITRTS